MGEIPVWKVSETLRRAAHRGLILLPPSRIRRTADRFPLRQDMPEEYTISPRFTLQWHITNVCDLACRHCYDRSERSPLTHKQGIKILDDMEQFCVYRRVHGHICFTGGNPFLHPNFFDLYKSASQRGFSTSILGNPVSRKKLEDLITLQKPNYFQVSLEGLPEHNDYIRGKGNFSRVIEFLGVLRDLKVSSAVMLTLTKDNIDQVLLLAERLRGHTDYFTFNRLSPVGEGANLQLPDPDAFHAFLEKYVEASLKNPIMGVKDNLINIIYHQRGYDPFGGCTGFGCGAAFSFFAVLPDGETHACRKFPSKIGNLFTQTIEEIYESDIARQYRAGTKACDDCSLRVVCGSCFSITYGMGLNIFTERDPYCFLNENEQHRFAK
jgi:selenobiotic family peptide radical SAM maturase